MNIVDLGLYATYVLVIVAALAAIILPLIKSLDNPASLGKSLLGVLAIFVVFLIGYLISSSEVEPYVKYNISSTTSKLVGGSLIALYILGAIAFVSIIYTEISKALK